MHLEPECIAQIRRSTGMVSMVMGQNQLADLRAIETIFLDIGGDLAGVAVNAADACAERLKPLLPPPTMAISRVKRIEKLLVDRRRDGDARHCSWASSRSLRSDVAMDVKS
jgi:hypothetical protein